jgi:hypothetical protein
MAMDIPIAITERALEAPDDIIGIDMIIGQRYYT